MSKIIAPPVVLVEPSDYRWTAPNSNLCFDPTASDRSELLDDANATPLTFEVYEILAPTICFVKLLSRM